MKERHFVITESMAQSFAMLDKRRAGELIQRVTDYVFKKKEYDGRDIAVKGYYLYIKKILDQRQMDIMYGKKGALIGKRNASKKKTTKTVTTTNFVAEGVMVVVEEDVREDANCKKEGVAKPLNFEAGKEECNSSHSCGKQSGNPILSEDK